MQTIELTKTLLQESKNKIVDILKRRYSSNLNKDLSQAVNELNEQGFSVMPNFLNELECNEIIAWINEVTQTNNEIWRDALDSDNRIYFSDKANKHINSFFNHELISKILSSYEKTDKYNGFTLANKVTYKENNQGSGGGWHRDYVKRKQTKAILYLNNVESSTGPFQYLKGSHQFGSILKYQKDYGFKYNQYRFTNSEIDEIIKQDPLILKEFTGAAGMLLLVDTRGIHRGVLYALTNYYWFNSSIPSHIKQLDPFK
jgi:hypothetical protein